MSSVARLCVLALIALFQISASQAIWSAEVPPRLGTTYQAEGDAPDDDDAPWGTTDERSTPMADDIFEIAALPVSVPRVRGVSADGRAGLALDELRRGRSAPDTPDKPPRA